VKEVKQRVDVGNVKTIIMAKKFKAHMMYKGKNAIMAKTYKKHLELKKKGYGHTKPKTKK